jgi:hypothetical protein
VIIIGTPHTHNSGYYKNDDRNSGGRLSEADIRTCPHCQAVIKMQEWAKAPVQNFCLKCMQPACNTEACQPCVPFIKKIEQHIQSQLRRLRLING